MGRALMSPRPNHRCLKKIRHLSRPLTIRRIVGLPRKYLDPVAVQHSHGVSTHKAHPGKNVCCFSHCVTGIGFMVDDPAEDFRLTIAFPRTEDVDEIDHAIELDPSGLLVNPDFTGEAEIRLTGGIRRAEKFRKILTTAPAAKGEQP
jgi:hypothetical protein